VRSTGSGARRNCVIDRMESTRANVHTLYVNNLNEKVSSKELYTALYSVFSTFGKIVDIVAAKTYKLRGQAWIVFDSAADAERALVALQGFVFYNKPMSICFARATSDVICKREGSYEKRDPGVRLKRKVENQEREYASRRNTFSTRLEDSGEQNEISSNFLLVQGLPDATTPQMLQLLFQQFPGFTCATLSENKPRTGLIEFDAHVSALYALRGLQGFRLNATHSLLISFTTR